MDLFGGRDDRQFRLKYKIYRFVAIIPWLV